MEHPNAELIARFYSAFNQRNYRVMQDAYAENASFSDPVFIRLSGAEVKKMWEMLVMGSRDLRVECKEVWADESIGRCVWEAWYTFTRTGRPVHNVINASFKFREGKIVQHSDQFDFWRWSRQALGLPGLLLGWSPLLRKKVGGTARTALSKFMSKV